MELELLIGDEMDFILTMARNLVASYLNEFLKEICWCCYLKESLMFLRFPLPFC
ncbi:hypothetical protein Scep_000672 [Stephania cephalantha]|uniref:Uncharacterized protein n=1 Tax=Stephania cephalantha TaxID=152367 RepID=A0AAP0L738_9MAGN